MATSSPSRPGVPREITNYLIPTEKIVFMIHVHWFRVLEPVASAVGGLLVLGFLDQRLPDVPYLRDVLVLGWLVLAVRALWLVIDWRLEWFLATDRRLLLVHGVIIRKVAMMPLAKVTDMGYNRSPVGKLFGYGQFKLESAGQDQALNTVDYVPNPNFFYQTLTSTLFAPQNDTSHDKMLPTSTGRATPIDEPRDAFWTKN